MPVNVPPSLRNPSSAHSSVPRLCHTQRTATTGQLMTRDFRHSISAETSHKAAKGQNQPGKAALPFRKKKKNPISQIWGLLDSSLGADWNLHCLGTLPTFTCPGGVLGSPGRAWDPTRGFSLVHLAADGTDPSKAGFTPGNPKTEHK